MKKIIQIKGMHCISCEIILEKELKNITGANLIMISHKKGIMEVDFKDESAYKEVVKAIEKNNFKVIEKGVKVENNSNGNAFLLNIIAIMLVAILFISTKIFNFNTFIPDTSSINYISAILLGIVASVSTCLAVTGGIIIGFGKYFDHEKSFLGHLKVQTGFQIGRILGFFLLGGILGSIGQVFSINFALTGILTIIVGLLLIYMGLNILGILPSLTKFGVHMPKSFASKIEGLGKPKYAPIVGALTFFLPCGFTQSMQLLAVSSGSFWVGGLVMMFFALGTFPVLYSLGLGSSYFTNKKFVILNTIIGAIVIFFGIFSISNSYKLVNFSSFSDSNTTISENLDNALGSIDDKDLEIVKVGYNGYATVPSEINLKAGGNYKLVVTPTSNGLGCMTSQVIPKLSNKVSYVKKGVDIVYEIRDAKAGTYDIVCGSMGMQQGRIIIN
ncbi:MAG: sulfite exporter TauE/SafE family protein [Candidatus Gracilibacteria bacterium]|nr:sulfite exporter TauE/SafE family protein [Candidatus Gracilibacteria bacterium]